MKRLIHLFFITLILLITTTVVVSIAFAQETQQETQQSVLQREAAITSVDTKRFPVVSLAVTTACPDDLSNSFAGYQLFEDNSLVQIDRSTAFTKEAETRTLILLDLWQGSDSYLGAIKRELREGLIDGAKFLDNRTDSVAVYLPLASGAAITNVLVENAVEGWTTDGGAIFNALEHLQSPSVATTQLTQLIAESATRLKPFANASKRLVLISNGYEYPPSDLQKQLLLFNDLGVHNIVVDTILLEEGIVNNDYLSRLATATGGKSYTLPVESALPAIAEPIIAELATISTTQSPTSGLASLWQSIPKIEENCRIHYRSAKPKPQLLALRGFSQAEGQTINDAFVNVDVPPPTIENLQISRSTLPISGSQFTLSISFTLGLAAYPERKIIQTDYYLEEFPENRWQKYRDFAQPINLTLNQLAAATYTLHVEVIDDLGLRGSAIAPFVVEAPVVAPQLPLPTSPESAPIETQTPLPWWQVWLKDIQAGFIQWQPFLLALVATIVLLGCAFWLLSLLEGPSSGGIEEIPTITSTRSREAERVSAVLYRTSLHKNMRQVIPLNNSTTSLAGESRNPNFVLDSAVVQQNVVTIKFENGKYKLIPEPGSDGGIKIRKDADEIPIAKRDTGTKIDLTDGDVITIGKLDLIFYEIDKVGQPQSQPEAFENGRPGGGT